MADDALDRREVSTVASPGRKATDGATVTDGGEGTEEAGPSATTAPPADPLIDAVIGGAYTLVARIGEGGMGAVYEARTSDDGTVALKLLRPAGGSEAEIRRFLREARSAMQLSSPHVVRVLAAGVDERRGTPFMVMERLRGADLASALERHAPLDPSVAARIFVDACEGLAAAHDAGMVHRDIKPSNLFLHEVDGAIVVKVCDFGVVKPDSVTEEGTSLTRSGALVGSPAYMAPEQAQDSKSVDARADVWSLAVALYEALTGRRAWEGHKNLGELMLKLYSRDIAPIQDAAPWIEPELAEVVHRGLARDVDRRHASARAFADALRPFASAAPLTPAAIRAVAADRRASVARRAAVGTATASAVVVPEVAPRRRVLAWAGVVAIVIGGAAVVVWRATAADTRAAPSSAAAAPAACVHARCLAEHEGRPSRCRPDGACVELETPRCKVLADDKTLRSEETVWVGAMFPTSDPQAYLADFGRASTRAMDLARRDFMSVTGGLPSVRAGGPARPLGVIACDDTGDAAPVARHLAVDAGVPAVVGFRSSTEAIEIAGEVFLPRGVLTIAALNASALITAVPHPAGAPRLVWRTTVGTPTRVQAIAGFVRDFGEPRARGGRPGDVRVALVRSRDAAGVALSEGLFQTLRLNGQPVLDARTSFRELTYEAGAEGARGGDAVTAEALTFRPDIVILDALADVVVDEILGRIEAGWPAGARRPIYVVPGSLEGAGLARLLDRQRDLGARLFGMDTPSSTPVNVKFTSSYNAAFGEHLSPALSPSTPYDSFYLLAYAACAAGVAQPSGADLARAIGRLVPPGKPIDVGPAHLLDAFGELAAGRSIDLQGAYTRMDFDLATGEPAAEYAILCASRGAEPGTVDSLESGLVYDGASDRLVGALDCSAAR